MLNVYLEYFSYFDHFENGHFYVQYLLLLFSLSSEEYLYTIDNRPFICVYKKLELHVLTKSKVCAFPKHLHLCISFQNTQFCVTLISTLLSSARGKSKFQL